MLSYLLPKVITNKYICLYAKECIKQNGEGYCHAQVLHTHPIFIPDIIGCTSKKFLSMYYPVLGAGYVNGCYVFSKVTL